MSVLIVNPSGASIGSSIGSGTPNSVLYLDGSGNLAQRNPGFTFDGSTFTINPSASGTSVDFQDTGGTSRSTFKDFGRLIINQNTLVADLDYAGASTILRLQDRGTERFTVFASGAWYVTRSMDCSTLTSYPGGMQFNQAVIGFLDNSTADILFYPLSDRIYLRKKNATPLGTPFLTMQAPSSTVSVRDQADIDTSWVTSTDATRKARVVYSVYDTAAREFMRAEASGSASMLGFFGASAIVQPVNTVAINDTLVNLGLRATGGASNFTTKLQIPSLAASTTEGDFWSDNTQKSLATFTDGIKQTLAGTIFTQTADKSVTNTVTETTIIGTGVGGLTLPANFFVAGKTIRITMSGVYSTVAVTGDTVTIKIKYGSTVLASKATSSLLTGATNLAWFSEVLITCRTTGATGTVQVSGGVIYQVASSATVEDELNNGVATTTLDTTASSLLDVTVTHSAASASNTVKSLVATVEVLN